VRQSGAKRTLTLRARFVGLGEAEGFTMAGSNGKTSIFNTLNPGDPILTGDGGDNFFIAPAGSSGINGLGGIDTVSFNFRLVDATVTYSGVTVIIDSATSHTELTGIQIYQFTDGTVNENDGNPLVDDLYYYAHNHDLWIANVDADAHFTQFGWHQSLNPSAFFDTHLYLGANPDVAAAGVDPLDHFHTVGWKEERLPSVYFDTFQYLQNNPDVAAATSV
jgi:serralysin